MTDRSKQPVTGEDDTREPITVNLEGSEGEDGDDGIEDPPLDQQDDGADDTGGQPPLAARGAPVPGRPTRPGGSPGRPSKLRNQLETLRKGNTTLQSDIATLKQTIAELQGRITGMGEGGGGGNRQPAQSAEEKQLGQVTSMMASLIKQSANPDLSQEQRNEVAQEYHRLDAQRDELKTKILTDRLRREILDEVRGQLPDPQTASYAGIISREFPALVDNRTASRLAKEYYLDLLEQNNLQRDSLPLMREAAAWAYKAMNLGTPRRAASERGITSGPAGGGGGERDRPGQRTFSPEELRIVRGAPVSPQEIAEYEEMERRGLV